METTDKIALGGGCHWCTEAIFQSLLGVCKVEQGYVAPNGKEASFSEAIIVHFNHSEITLKVLLEIHLHTHKSTSNHSMRKKYRSAVYAFSENQMKTSRQILDDLQILFEAPLITQVLPFKHFKPSRWQIQNYYYGNPQKPFCKKFIMPKVRLLTSKYPQWVNPERLNGLRSINKPL